VPWRPQVRRQRSSTARNHRAFSSCRVLVCRCDTGGPKKLRHRPSPLQGFRLHSDASCCGPPAFDPQHAHFRHPRARKSRCRQPVCPAAFNTGACGDACWPTTHAAHPRLAKVDTADQLPHDHDVNTGHHLRLECRRVRQLRQHLLPTKQNTTDLLRGCSAGRQTITIRQGLRQAWLRIDKH